MTQYHVIRRIVTILIAAVFLLAGACFHTSAIEAAQTE